MSTLTLIANRYELQDKLGEGGMGVVYRAFDRLTGDVVALKQVTTPLNALRFASEAHHTKRHLALAQEFKVLAGLRHPNIISVLEYGFVDNQQPYFTMELLEKPQKLWEAAQGQSIEFRINLIIQILQALAYLHRRGIVHRDIKPSNIMVNDEYVRVLDFGLAVAVDDAREEVVGTMAYVAPEVLNKKSPTIASDLYAVGIMTYELLVGSHPFDTSNPMQLFADTLHSQPDLSPLERLKTDSILSAKSNTSEIATPSDETYKDADVTYTDPDATYQPGDKLPTAKYDEESAIHPLAPIVGKLLAKDPQERYQNALTVVHELNLAIGQTELAEVPAIRESYLVSAPFIGRQAELTQLTETLDQLLNAEVAYSFWLVGGESGVGKSRLLDELRTHALVQGVHVVRAQGVQEGGLPFQLWREIVPHLLLEIDIDNVEAGILREIVPHIDKVLGHEIPIVASLEGEAHQERLTFTLANLFKYRQHSMLLILEDLQWTRESLLPLVQLSKIKEQVSNLFIVGSYRYEEHRNLPEELPDFEVITLERLNREKISELSQAMLGEVGTNPELVDLLMSQTEGNTFFMVEVVRALAEDAGQLNAIANIELPEHIFTGGMQAILQRRLDQIPQKYQPVLHYAAIIGRQIDERLLRHILPDIDLQDWLYQAEAAVVLSAQGDQWQFSHDKLRDAVIYTLTDGVKADLHHNVALAIEHVYQDDENYNQLLLEHWHRAGNLDKEIHYLLQVAQRLIDIEADYQQAQNLLERGLKTLSSDDSRRISLLNWQAKSYEKQANYQQATQLAQLAQSLAEQTNDQFGMAHSLINLGHLAFNQGNYTGALNYYQSSLDIYRVIDDLDGIANSLNCLGMVNQQQGNSEQARIYQMQSLGIKETLDDQRGIASSLGNLGEIAMYQGDYELARDYYEQSITIQEIVGDKFGIALNLARLADIAINQSDFEQAQVYLHESIAIREAINDQRGIAGTYLSLGNIAYRHGNYQQAGDYYQQSRIRMRAIGNLVGVGNALVGLGVVADQLGDYTQAIDCYQQSMTIMKDTGHRIGIAMCLNNLGLIAYYQGNYEQSQDYYQQSLVIREEIGHQHGIATALSNLGNVVVLQGNYEDAKDFHEQSLVIRQNLDDKHGVADCFTGLGLIYYLLEDYTRAADYYQQALKVDESTNHQLGVGDNLFGLGLVAYGQGDYAQARDYHAKGLAIRENIKDQRGIISSLTYLGIVYTQLDYPLAQKTFRDALQRLKSLSSVRLRVELITGIIGFYVLRKDFNLAAELIGLVQNHPASNSITAKHLQEFIPQLEEILEPTEFQSALARGQALDLDIVIQDIRRKLAEEGAMD